MASRYAAFLASAGIAALLRKMDCKDVTIAIDGSLFRYHPHFKNIMKSRISQLMETEYKFDLMLSEDGSGRGVSMVAAMLKSGDRKCCRNVKMEECMSFMIDDENYFICLDRI